MTDEERREAERLARDRWPGDKADIETDVIHARARSVFEQGYAAGCEAKRAEFEFKVQEKNDALFNSWACVERDLKSERARTAKLLEVLDYYARHDHWLGATGPNFAREAIAEYEAGK